MRRLLADRGPSKAWVFLKDKGIGDGEELRDALLTAEATLHPRQRARRELRRELPGLVDLRDFPVARDYVQRAETTGARVVVESSWLNALSVLASESELEALAALPFVDRIEPVRRGELIDAVPAPPQEAQYRPPAPASFYGLSLGQLEQINLVRVHRRGYTGQGVVVGILDTGFHRGHEALNQPSHVVQVLAEYDFINDDGNTGKEAGDPASQHAHGTYILGTIAAYLPGTLVGGAYDASFVLAKTEDVSNEYQQEEDFYVSGLQFIEAQGGDVATSSLAYIDWYTQGDLDGLTAVTTIGVNVATSNGVICLTAASNSGHDADPGISHLGAPADALQVLTIGAVDSTGTIAGFSSDGPSADGRVKPELLAQGVSTQTICAYTDAGCTSAVSGTSLSTPVMAAAVACLVQAHPGWSVSTMRNRLMASGDYFLANGTYDPLFVLGYGIPDVERAGFTRPVHERTDLPLQMR